jgi:hypothetical protein
MMKSQFLGRVLVKPQISKIRTFRFSSTATAATTSTSGGSETSSLIYENDISACTSSSSSPPTGRYCKIGQLLLDEEIPKQFEKLEWSKQMFPPPPRAEAFTKDELIKLAIEEAQAPVPERGGRWDDPDLIPENERFLMLRESGISLCKDLEKAGESHTGFARVLTGKRGCGKSSTLLHALTWARASGWLTLFMPRASRLVTHYGALLSGTGGPIALLPNSTVGNGLFQQPNAAQAILENTSEWHGEALSLLPQRRSFKHDLYKAKQGQSPTLAHILIRGLMDQSHAADALYDLRMEFNLIEEVPVLIAVDELNALYWPTVLYFQGRSVKAHELVIAQAFRFVKHVPGDVEDDPNPKTVRNAAFNPIHLPKRGAIIGATTRSAEAPSHKEQIPPARFDDFPIRGLEKVVIPRYNEAEVNAAMAWYQIRNVCGPQSPEALGKCRVMTSGIPEKVANYALGVGANL